MKTLKKLIKEGKFDWVNSNINSDNFPAPKEIRTDFKLYHFNKYISSKNAIKEMEKYGYRPANIYELLSWKDWNGTDFVSALGSVAEVDGGRFVACLYGFGSERCLYLFWFGSDWRASFRFLAVRNSSLRISKTKNPNTLILPDILTINGFKYKKQ